jgi:hypothetical protein
MVGATNGHPGRGAHAAADEPLHPGRITVSERALNRVAEAITAEALGVDRKKLTVTLSASGGGLAVQVRSPLGVPDLDDDEAVNAAGSIIDRLTRAQSTIRERGSQIMGRPVARVNIRINGAEVAERKRVL